MTDKVIIYQVFTRLFGNRNTTRKQWGSIEENGTGKLADFDLNTLRSIKEMGVSHIWYTGVIRHATQTDYSAHDIPRQHGSVVKGRAGSPYAICDYYDIDPDLATDIDKRMEEFDALVERTHKTGLKMIIDFVPNHVARQYKSIAKPAGVVDLGGNDDVNMGFSPQNNFYYCCGCHFEPYFDKRIGICDGDYVPDEKEEYDEFPCKATGNDHFDNHPGRDDWYETVKLNYGMDYWAHWGYYDPVPDTWNKMTDILLFWASKGVDGFRCDMAEMVPANFWAYATDRVKKQYKDIIFIGEVYNPAEYRNYIASGFDYLYDKVGMYDAMRAVTCGFAPARCITQNWQSVDDINSHMLFFLENHDEKRIASEFFAGDARKGIPAMVASVLMKASPFMLYAGEEYGEKGMDQEGYSGRDGRTTIFDYWSIDTLCRASEGKLTDEEKYIYSMHEKTMQIARGEKAIDGDFYDVMYVNYDNPDFNADKQFAFFRKKGGELLFIVVNFDENEAKIKVRVPAHMMDFHAIPERKFHAKDLLTEEMQDIVLQADGVVPMVVPEYGARVWKMAYRETSKKK